MWQIKGSNLASLKLDTPTDMSKLKLHLQN